MSSYLQYFDFKFKLIGLTQYPCNKLRAESLNTLKRFDYRRS